MAKKRIVTSGQIVAALAMTLAGLVMVASPAHAQDQPYETCAAYGTVSATGGATAIDAAERLRSIGAPNPLGIEAALDAIVDAEDFTGSQPVAEALQAAYDTLNSYYGELCAEVDICPLIRQAVATNDGSSADAARLARGITAPAPPGIDAALALIAGAITVEESPFHDSVAAAQEQVASYFQCDVELPTDETPPDDMPDDICPLVRQAIATNDASSAEAAGIVRELMSPSPPGIDAALALIAGDITVEESPFHDSVAAAQEQIADYFPCDIDAVPDGGGGEIAFTGTTTLPLAMTGFGLLAAGAFVLRVSKRD